MQFSGIYRKGFPLLLFLIALICVLFPLHAFGSSGESGGGDARAHLAGESALRSGSSRAASVTAPILAA